MGICLNISRHLFSLLKRFLIIKSFLLLKWVMANRRGGELVMEKNKLMWVSKPVNKRTHMRRVCASKGQNTCLKGKDAIEVWMHASESDSDSDNDSGSDIDRQIQTDQHRS